jgi:thiamine-phosphate pyrophosphorylase
MRNKLDRAIDANLNRAREALRVCEDITRFVLNDATLTASLKNIRHKISRLKIEGVITSRNTISDIGRKASFDKAKPKDFNSLFYNNIHRAEESIRALEEFSKLINGKAHLKFKAIRFKVYLIEKKAIKKLKVFCDTDRTCKTK